MNEFDSSQPVKNCYSDDVIIIEVMEDANGNNAKTVKKKKMSSAIPIFILGLVSLVLLITALTAYISSYIFTLAGAICIASIALAVVGVVLWAVSLIFNLYYFAALIGAMVVAIVGIVRGIRTLNNIDGKKILRILGIIFSCIAVLISLVIVLWMLCSILLLIFVFALSAVVYAVAVILGLLII